MSWLSALVLGYIALVLELSLRHVLALGNSGVAPYFVLPCAVYIGLYASRGAALWGAMALGTALDLAIERPGTGTAFVLGPSALGLTLGVYLVLTLRAMFNRRNPLVFATMCVLAGLVSSLIAVLLLRVHATFDPGMKDYLALGDLWPRLGSCLLSFPYAVVLSLPLRWATPWMNFEDPLGRRRY